MMTEKEKQARARRLRADREKQRAKKDTRKGGAGYDRLKRGGHDRGRR